LTETARRRAPRKGFNRRINKRIKLHINFRINQFNQPAINFEIESRQIADSSRFDVCTTEPTGEASGPRPPSDIGNRLRAAAPPAGISFERRWSCFRLIVILRQLSRCRRPLWVNGLNRSRGRTLRRATGQQDSAMRRPVLRLRDFDNLAQDRSPQ
jgi:hypothetical protein